MKIPNTGLRLESIMFLVEKGKRPSRDVCGRKGTRTPDLFNVSEAL
jgi:hypothetical protein